MNFEDKHLGRFAENYFLPKHKLIVWIMVAVSRNLSDHFSYFLRYLFQVLSYGFQREKKRCQERLEEKRIIKIWTEKIVWEKQWSWSWKHFLKNFLNSNSESFKRASFFKCNCIIVCTIISEYIYHSVYIIIYWSHICGKNVRTM